MVHGDEVGGELAAEVIPGLQLPPVDVGVHILCLLESVRDVALRHAHHHLAQHRGHQVAITAVCRAKNSLAVTEQYNDAAAQFNR